MGKNSKKKAECSSSSRNDDPSDRQGLLSLKHARKKLQSSTESPVRPSVLCFYAVTFPLRSSTKRKAIPDSLRGER